MFVCFFQWVCNVKCINMLQKQGWNLGFPSEMTALSSEPSELSNRCLQPQPHLLSAATANSLEIKVANLVQLLKNRLICASTSAKGCRAEIQVEGTDNHLRPKSGQRAQDASH